MPFSVLSVVCLGKFTIITSVFQMLYIIHIIDIVHTYVIPYMAKSSLTPTHEFYVTPKDVVYSVTTGQLCETYPWPTTLLSLHCKQQHTMI